jgi:hypothetical protein
VLLGEQAMLPCLVTKNSYTIHRHLTYETAKLAASLFYWRLMRENLVQQRKCTNCFGSDVALPGERSQMAFEAVNNR